jgi:hypothetical protein
VPSKLVYLQDLRSATKAYRAIGKAKSTIKALAKPKSSKSVAQTGKGAAHKAKPSPASAVSPEPTTLGFKIVLDSKGHRHKLQTVDARSATFGHDFTTAFKKSVQKARRENTRIISRSDLAATK